MIKVNFIIENYKTLKYLGCSTAAIQFLDILNDMGLDVRLNSKENKFDIIHAHTFGPYAIFNTIKNKKTLKIVSAHSTPSINKGNIVLGDCKLWDFVYSSIYNRFDYVLAVSDFSVNELKKIGVRKNIFVVENGVDTKKFRKDKKKGKAFRNANDFDKKDFVVLNVAQITPRKGVYDFINVANKIPELKFVWVGGFPYKFGSVDYFKLKKITEKNAGLDNLRFMGFVPDIVGAYSGSDVLFTPSFAETFGLTVIEAGACKLPVIGRNLEVFKKLFDDKIVYGNSCNDFVDELEEFRDNKFKRKQGIKSYELSKKYNIKKIASKLFYLYNSLYEKVKN